MSPDETASSENKEHRWVGPDRNVYYVTKNLIRICFRILTLLVLIFYIHLGTLISPVRRKSFGRLTGMTGFRFTNG
jgi:hypothetical protein